MGIIFLKEVASIKFLVGCAVILVSVLISELKPSFVRLKRLKIPV